MIYTGASFPDTCPPHPTSQRHRYQPRKNFPTPTNAGPSRHPQRCAKAALPLPWSNDFARNKPHNPAYAETGACLELKSQSNGVVEDTGLAPLLVINESTGACSEDAEARTAGYAPKKLPSSRRMRCGT